ncbi:methyltransferase domain protein [Rubidibacter lacunae KORDI 51-2]|uniref:Methyltransferase domain protein n=1 Tax=Rubidibacter lacunae KORDI 51-2 TaxID=582515 RepID=U5DF50_9CHRO|nr:methyltransferase domain-containing protein [Rubidibacter lacunae]ERN40236.1 methyltransferase domain protein [Rubidibacter lacunae KORDI 51-2]
MSSTLNRDIRRFYDASSALWERTWGEHMHHGYYGRSGTRRVPRRQAQIDLIEEFWNWGVKAGTPSASEDRPQQILDVGCGIGGSTLYLAETFNARATGITLSPVQADRASERAAAAGLDDRVRFEVADALAMPFPDNSFDIVWSLESGEHMPDKAKFLRECDRVLRPGGLFLMATWCHRPTASLAGALTDEERRHLNEIYRVYCLPYVISLPDYEEIARALGWEGILTADWSAAVAPFWDVVIASAFNLETIQGLVSSGWQTVQAALSLGLMSKGYARGLIRFGLLAARKSEYSRAL